MWDFFRELARNLERTYTVMLMDDEYRETPRTYQLEPRKVLAVLGGASLGGAILLVLLIIFTPVRNLLPAYNTAEMEHEARLSALRLSALEDSLAVQQEYMVHLRRLMTGDFDAHAAEPAMEQQEDEAASVLAFEEQNEERSDDWTDHTQPALYLARMPALQASTTEPPAHAQGRYLSSLQLPASPPVSGLITRDYDPRGSHYGIDFAVDEGTMVQSVGDGYVILADWTHEGGYTIAVQHAEGYVSVYKHNQRLLKRAGDRVRAQEAIALSGNSGEITTGPHLHFEFWQNGLAQDPRHYLVGL